MPARKVGCGSPCCAGAGSGGQGGLPQGGTAGAGAADTGGNGGNGGAIYNDGDDYDLVVCGADMHANTANEGGGAIFYVSNNMTGGIAVQNSHLSNNPSLGFETSPGLFVKAAFSDFMGSTIE